MLTFDDCSLSILLTEDFMRCETKEEHYCFLHPGKKHKCLRNKYTKYCELCRTCCSYYNLLDDWGGREKLRGVYSGKGFEKIYDTHRGIVSAPDESSAGLPRKKAACMREGKTIQTSILRRAIPER